MENNNILEINPAKLLNIKSLDISDNPISKLIFQKGSKISSLTASSTLIDELDLSNLLSLRGLKLNQTKVKQLILPGSSTNPNKINHLEVSYGKLLESLDLSACTNLDYLSCNDNKLSSIQFGDSKNLTFLSLENNKIRFIDFSKFINLRHASCSGNLIQKLDFSQNQSHQFISCYRNRLSELVLPKDPRELRTLYCGLNNLTKLDITEFVNLESFHCENNLINSLPLGKKPLLTMLDCSNNPISTIDLKNCEKLQNVTIDSCKIKDIDVTRLKKLEFLDIRVNKLTKINLINNKNIAYLYVGRNPIKEIDLSNLPDLFELEVGNTEIKQLNVSKNLRLRSLFIDYLGLTSPINLCNNNELTMVVSNFIKTPQTLVIRDMRKLSAMSQIHSTTKILKCK